jgi:hypothetical protein
MEDVRIQVDTIGPHDRSRNRINGDQREHGWILERLEDATLEYTVKVELTDEPI